MNFILQIGGFIHMTLSLMELFILAVGLSMDAFAVAVCKGLALEKINLKKVCLVGLWFGIFQALMPLLGYILGSQFAEYVNTFAPWIAFALLLLIGGNMIKESFGKEEEKANDSLAVSVMFLLAIATSIDALAVGITFSLMKLNIVAAIAFIGVTTFVISCVGVKIGSVFGSKYKSKAEFAGGVILIIIGVKILLEGLGII